MYQKTVLDNGIRLVTERLPSRTVSVGIWVEVGSRDEHDLNSGCAHFLEHMLFKGTASRSARQIAEEIDALGGTTNAFTSTDCTCFYATVLDIHLQRLMDLFADFFQNSLFDQKEVERERQVILQEISMVDDTPDDQIHDLFASLLWGKHPLGNTVLGSREVVASMDSHKLKDYFKRLYTSNRILIAAAGNVEHREFADLCQKRFTGLASSDDAGPGKRLCPPVLPAVRKVYSKPLEQVHMILGTCGLPIISEDRYALLILNTLLGGNMSSRLFQEIRENRGLAYSVYSYVVSYMDSGIVAIYLGVDRENANEAVSLVVREIDRMKQSPVTGEELNNAKDYAKGGVFLAAENMEARMTRIARNELCFGRSISLDELADAIDRVSADDVRRLAEQIFAGELTAAVLGPLETNDINWQTF